MFSLVLTVRLLKILVDLLVCYLSPSDSTVCTLTRERVLTLDDTFRLDIRCREITYVYRMVVTSSLSA